MTNKHTPGPWHLQEPDFLCDKGSLLNLTCESRASKGFSKSARVNIADIHIGFDEPFESEQLANARLIAAAPELLAALEWCQTVYGADWPENASIRETIKKARGQA